MPTLTAKFSIDLSAACLVAWPEELPAEFNLTLDAFDICLRIRPVDGQRMKHKDDPDWTSVIYSLELDLSRDEAETPPAAIATADGKKDLTVQSMFLRERLPDFQATALDISNRFLRFFQYTLNTPLIRPIPGWAHELSNPIWYDSSGAELRGGTATVIAEPVPGIRGELGVKKLTPALTGALVAFLQAPQQPSLAQTLISDAQTAWFEGNLRRAVLELAICTEVMVKRKFFAKASPAGAAFDYLEDKAKVSVRVLELLDAVAEEAFSRSFRKEDPTQFRRIDELFRCRNKIAHRGELVYRSDSGDLIKVDAATVESWWHSVAHLKSWLDAQV